MAKDKADSDHFLERIADALERLSPPPATLPDFRAPAYLYSGKERCFEPVENLPALPLDLFVGVDIARDTLLANTLRFARGERANNALLWGARGMGKSSLVKSICAHLRADYPLTLIEILRDELGSLGSLTRLLRGTTRRVVLYCDDLSFEYEEAAYKALKAALDGGVLGVPENILFYASSNRRHLMAREMIENERRAAIHDSEAMDEKISLSDRFGLWLGFHKASQNDYLEMIRRYLDHFGVRADEAEWSAEAIEWSATRGARSGRVAWQFFEYYKGKIGA